MKEGYYKAEEIESLVIFLSSFPPSPVHQNTSPLLSTEQQWKVS